MLSKCLEEYKVLKKSYALLISLFLFSAKLNIANNKS